jgi:hypothetical protein
VSYLNRARLAVLALAIPLAAAVPLAASTAALAQRSSAGAAALAPTPSPTPSASTPAGGSTPQATPDDGNRAWSARPATEGKPDNRTHFTLQGSPGQNVIDQVMVTNSSKVDAKFDIYATDAFNTSTGAFDLLPAAKKPVDIGSWVTFPANTVEIPANKSVVVEFRISVPSSATPGDHAGGVVISLSTGSAVRLDTRVAVRLYLRVPGNLRPTLQVAYVEPTYHGTGNPFGSGSMDLNYTIINNGNIRLQSHPKVTVKSALFGSELASVKPADLAEILPGQQVTYSAHLDGIFPAGPLTVTVEVQPFADPLQPVGQNIPAFSADATVWAVPWILLILVILIIGGVGFLVVRMVLRRRGGGGSPKPVKDKPKTAPKETTAKDTEKEKPEELATAGATTGSTVDSEGGSE